MERRLINVIGCPRCLTIYSHSDSTLQNNGQITARARNDECVQKCCEGEVRMLIFEYKGVLIPKEMKK